MPVAIMAVINIFCLVYRNIGYDKYLAKVKNLDIAGKQRGWWQFLLSKVIHFVVEIRYDVSITLVWNVKHLASGSITFAKWKNPLAFSYTPNPFHKQTNKKKKTVHLLRKQSDSLLDSNMSRASLFVTWNYLKPSKTVTSLTQVTFAFFYDTHLLCN